MEIKNYDTKVPPEIWTKIFELLAKSEPDYSKNLYTSDIFNIYHVCVTFENILKSTIISSLFPQILPLIHPYITNNIIKPLLNCRLVCKSWRKGVDHFLETHDIFYRKQLQDGQGCSNYFISSSPNKSLPMTCLYTKRDITKFLRKTNNEKSSPFLGNSLLLRCSPFDNQTGAIYLSSISLQKLLIRFGRFVKVLHLFIFQYQCPYELEVHFPYTRLYDQIKNILENTPNLRRLSIQGYLNMSGIQNPSFENANSTVDWEVGTFKLPGLESVEIDIGGRHSLSSKLAIHLDISSSSLLQLKRLSLSLSDSTLFEYLEDVFPQRKTDPQLGSNISGCILNLEQLEVRIMDVGNLLEIFHLAFKITKLRCLIIKIATHSWEDHAKLFSKYYPYNADPYYRSLYTTEYKRESCYLIKYRIVLGDLLSIVGTLFGNSLKTLIIFAEDKARKCCTANQHDLEFLGEMPNLRNLQIEGFSLRKLEILEKLPATLKTLVLSGHLRNFDFDSSETNEFKMMSGVSSDLKDGWTIYHSEMWELVPSLRWMRVVLWDHKTETSTVYIYRKEKREWLVTRYEEQVKQENWCCNVV